MCLFSDENRKEAQQLLIKYYQADLLRSTFGSLGETTQLILTDQDKNLRNRVLALTDLQLKDELTCAKTHPTVQGMDDID
ncbi:hypothetical protein [Enterococcus faecium]|uniref:hypothetical protein n=1 Tax=Enterococcus faecium TaxID=1352 RepID=UPI001914508F|nr:hypothetical protein [Enterococcus faecium]MBK5028657.1 hypothetical protein [Enterococcus faecium]MBK5039331.1 hypothetical protein [Enterococcus faecium]MBK5044419.1 hypothetical protein [Enterococcus faecium]MBK5069285.1 hypothetical protein [Enterococcus faecium]MBK5132423.1 hypothetical protein [Enterococcus faecium]